MKSINEYLNEALVNEAQGQLVVLISNEHPGTINIIKNVTNKKYIDKLIEDISDRFIIGTVPYSDNSIYEISYNGNNIDINDTKCKSEEELRNGVKKSIEQSLQKCKEGSKVVDVDFSPLQVKNSFKSNDNEMTYYSEMKNTPAEWFYRWLMKFYEKFTPKQKSDTVKVVWSSSNSQVTSYNNIILGDIQIFSYKNEKEFERYRKRYLDF